MSKTPKAVVIALVLFCLALVFAWTTLTAQPERRAFINGKILTMDADNSIVEAVLIDEGRIIAVGSTADINALIDKYTSVTDLNGRTLMPGIIDAHGHFPGSGIYTLSTDLNSPPVGRITSLAELQDALRHDLEGLAEGQWLLGVSYDDTLLVEQRHPNRYELDQVSSKHPIFIMHVSGHMGVANSLALRRADIDKDTPNPEGGVIVRDPSSGEATGLLEETAMKPLQVLAMDFSAWDFLQMIRHAADEYARVGVTTAQSGGVDPRMYAGLRYASRFGLLKSRLLVFPLADEMGPAVLEHREEFAAHNTDWFNVGPVKIIADGSIQGYTGYLSKPYHQAFHGDVDYRGYPVVPLDDLIEQVDRYHRNGVQLAIHGNGDASMDDIITAFEAAQEKHPNPDPRLILIHAQMARADQLEAFKRLGISPSFFVAHTYYWGDRHRDLFMGPERAANMSPTAWAIEQELPFSIHLDTPVVPMQPFLLVWSAVNRQSASGQIIGPQQRIMIMDALRAVTIDAAWQVFQEHNRGSLEVGKWADLIVLLDDPLINPAGIKDIQVLETVVAGKTVYQRGIDAI